MERSSSMRVILMVLVMAAITQAQTTRPATELQRLRQENAALKRQVEELTARLAALGRAPTSRPAVSDEIATAIAKHQVVRGMTVEQAESACGKGKRTAQLADGSETWEWEYSYPGGASMVGQPAPPTYIDRYTCEVKDGKILAVAIDTRRWR